MGPEPSLPVPGNIHPFSNDLYLPMSSDLPNGQLIPMPSSKCTVVHRVKIIKSAFTGIWSIHTPNCLAPQPRTGHYTVIDEEKNIMYIGNGLGADGETILDLWALDLNTYTWRNIPLCGTEFSPRVGARAILNNGFLIVFGGYSAPNYYADLHTINLETGEIKVVITNGEVPEPRSTPIIAMYGQELFVWGGFNGRMLSDLHILHLDTMTWETKKTDVSGRTAAPFVTYGDKIYSFGSSKQGGLLEIDMTNHTVNILKTIGSEPPSAVMSAGMARVDNLVFFFGGKSNSQWTLIYACDLTKRWWFVFHVMPDGESVSVSDGSVSDIGLFMLPRLNSFSLVYNEPRRELVATLGEPHNDPPQLFLVQIGEALSVIHMRDDLIDVLHLSNPSTHFA